MIFDFTERIISFSPIMDDIIQIVIINNIIGSRTPAEVMHPVVIINVIKIGINRFMNDTRFCIASFTMVIISEKLEIIRATIIIY